MNRLYQHVWFAVWCSLLFGAAAQAGDEAKIKQIRQWYGEVQKDASLKKTSYKTGEDEEPHSVTLTRYTTAKGELRKLHMAYGGEHGSATVTYYFKEGKLFFVYSTDEAWHFIDEKGVDGQSKTMNLASQGRYYFADDKCIRALQKKVQSKDVDQLPALLKKAENKSMDETKVAPGYLNLKNVKILTQVKSRKDLERFLSESE